MKALLFLLLSISCSLFCQEVPRYGAWGIDLAAQDGRVLPGDDFFRFVNGRWLDEVQISPDAVSVSVSQRVRDIVEARLHALLEQADGKVGIFYRSFMNEKLIDALGARPMARERRRAP